MQYNFRFFEFSVPRSGRRELGPSSLIERHARLRVPGDGVCHGGAASCPRRSGTALGKGCFQPMRAISARAHARTPSCSRSVGHPLENTRPPAQAFSADAGFESQISNPSATQEHRRWRRALWLRTRECGCSVNLLRLAPRKQAPSRRASSACACSTAPRHARNVNIEIRARINMKRAGSGTPTHANGVSGRPQRGQHLYRHRSLRPLLQHLCSNRRARHQPWRKSSRLPQPRRLRLRAMQMRCDASSVNWRKCTFACAVLPTRLPVLTMRLTTP